MGKRQRACLYACCGNQLSCECLGLGWFCSRLSCGKTWAKHGQDSKFLCLDKLKRYEKLLQVTKTAIPLPRPRPGAARTDSATVFLTTYYCISGSRGNNGVIAAVFFFEVLWNYSIIQFRDFTSITLVAVVHLFCVTTGWCRPDDSKGFLR